MIDPLDPHNYLWPGDAPRHIEEVPPPRPAWEWWKEETAPSYNDYLDWRFPYEGGNAIAGVLLCLVVVIPFWLIVVGVAAVR